MRLLPAFCFVEFIFLYSLADALALPLLNATTTAPPPSTKVNITVDEGHHYPIPGTPLTLHLTLFPTRIPLPAENTLHCLHNFAKVLASEPQSDFLDRRREQTAYNVEAIIAPVNCPGCGLTYGESTKVLAGLWYYTSREKLLYVQRYGVFESRTGRMVAWGKLLTAPPAPGPGPGMLGGMEMISTLPSGLAETS
ncbi:hypothetical protein HO133_006528 [Letharia lupina]|uniref:Uncharacterized protein n=1 Tax=Letharia lupina TaxID=560253 RepID=A0A8H6F7D6_9LECA|nr:uncharacterized protein HO133_006528 [Letharia lupina]KAF6217701.1 hypothetical protein HO133_006528 [Letharia lupina]